MSNEQNLNKDDLEEGQALGDDLAPPALDDTPTNADELAGEEVEPDFDDDVNYEDEEESDEEEDNDG